MAEIIPSTKPVFEKLSKQHLQVINSFQNQEKELVDFLVEDALANQAMRISTTYLAFLTEGGFKKLVGYVSLLSDSIRVKENKELLVFFDNKGIHYSCLPALKIGRLAVDALYQKKGIGTHLILFSISTGSKLSDNVGCRFITTDAKPEAIDFYNKLGFRVLKERKGKLIPMYFDLSYDRIQLD